jgi:hypothetical protein
VEPVQAGSKNAQSNPSKRSEWRVLRQSGCPLRPVMYTGIYFWN